MSKLSEHCSAGCTSNCSHVLCFSQQKSLSISCEEWSQRSTQYLTIVPVSRESPLGLSDGVHMLTDHGLYGIQLSFIERGHANGNGRHADARQHYGGYESWCSAETSDVRGHFCVMTLHPVFWVHCHFDIRVTCHVRPLRPHIRKTWLRL